jgi:hypothetical protein
VTDTRVFLEAIQSRTARVAVGASTVRGPKNAGVMQASRGFLRTLPLGPFGVADDVAFRAALDRSTQELRDTLPEEARSWGLARKILNIFLRDCLYTVYLREAYTLEHSEPYYELPLDSVVAKALRSEPQGRTLTRWPGVSHLTPAISEAYQKFASNSARSRAVERVHLDAFLWSISRDSEGAAHQADAANGRRMAHRRATGS